MAHEYDAIIAGAGPAGSASAIVLGQAGKKVLLVDKSAFPRDKTCGDGLTFKCFEPLKRLGLLERFLEKVEFKAQGYSLWFSDYSEVTVRRTMDDSRHFVYILPRLVFDHLMLEKALQFPSVTFMPDTRIHQLVMKGPVVIGVEADCRGAGSAFHSPITIDACGANSSLAVQVGSGNQNPRQCALAIRGYYDGVEALHDTVEFYFDPNVLPGYFWIFPTSPTSANIGCGTFQHIIEERRIDLRSLFEHFFLHHPIAKKKLAHARLCGTLSGGKIPLAIDYNRSRVRDGFIMTGDAASFTDPITAEGISYALHSGILAGETAIRALDAGDFTLKNLEFYDAAWKKKFNKQFSKAPFLTEILSKNIFSEYLAHSFDSNARAESAIGDLASQYELMFKLKALMKAI